MGVRAAEADWAFTLSRRRLAVREWRLGPVEGESEPEPDAAGEVQQGGEKKGKQGLEF